MKKKLQNDDIIYGYGSAIMRTVQVSQIKGVVLKNYIFSNSCKIAVAKVFFMYQ